MIKFVRNSLFEIFIQLWFSTTTTQDACNLVDNDVLALLKIIQKLMDKIDLKKKKNYFIQEIDVHDLFLKFKSTVKE